METPNGYEFSAAAKVYLCADKLLPPASQMLGYQTSSGIFVETHLLAKGVMLATIQSLQDTGYIELRVESIKRAFGTETNLMVRAVYSGAPGFSGRFLEATQWRERSVDETVRELLVFDRRPLYPFTDSISTEFAEAGVIVQSAEGPTWESEWLTYLREGWYPEVYELWNRSHARPDRELIENDFMMAIGARTDSTAVAPRVTPRGW